MKLKQERSAAELVSRFLSEMHRYDAGRTLPLMYGAKLSTPQLAVLEFVRAARTVSTVALHVGLSRPATSQMINKLVDRGLVGRSEGSVDRREKVVTLTSEGRELLDRISAARAARFEASLAGLSPRIVARLKHTLEDVLAELHKATR
ncbi:MAG: MarR family winged helix-turn-helix transcriptional regulator [Candidatus Acidiferrales bacterium]